MTSLNALHLLSFKQAVKSASFWIILSLFSASLIVAKLFSLFTFGLDTDYVILFSTASLFGVVIVLSHLCNPRKILNLMILSKPLGREQALFGRFSGALNAIGLGLVVLSLLFFFLRAAYGQFPGERSPLAAIGKGLLAGLLLPLIQTALFYSLFLFLSFVFSSKVSYLLTILLFVFGGYHNFLVEPLINKPNAGIISFLKRAPFYLVPNFHDLGERVVSLGQGGGFSLSLFFSSIYSTVLTAFFLCISLALFHKKDIQSY